MNEDMTLAELATTRPGASRVFHRYHLDFCCGGGQSLKSVCQARGLESNAVLAEIQAAETPRDDLTDAAKQSTKDLVATILKKYHEPLRGELDRLLQMAEKVENRHGDKTTCPRGIAEHMRHVSDAVRAHLTTEEDVLFPMLTSGQGVSARDPVLVLMEEHDEHAANLKKTRALTTDLVPPTEACNTWRALYLGLEQLERDLMEHIHLENNVLFARVLGPLRM